MLITNFAETPANEFERFFPRRRCELAVLADERRREALFVVGKIETVAPLDAEKVIVDAALVAIVAANNFHAGIAAPHAERGLAAIGTMRANRPDVIHLPGARLVAIGPGCQRADRTDVDAHAALFAIEMIVLIGRDDRGDATI